MKKKKLILIIIAVCCALLAGAVTIFALTQSKCNHKYGAGKTYHITNNEVYYTLACTKDGHIKRFETKASFTDVLSIVTDDDLIVLDEDITLTNSIDVKSYLYSETTNLPNAFDLEINLNLNSYTITTEIESATNDTVFMFDATFGTIDFDITNGSIYTDDAKYIFNFKNNNTATNTIDISIDNVECTVMGGGEVTPLFVDDTCSNIDLEANNSKFIAKNAPDSDDNMCVGAFINSNSQFDFINCYFEGGDGLYIKRGIVNLTGCELVNKDLVDNTTNHGVSATFRPVGSCLTAESYNQEGVGYSQFNITITNCTFNSTGSIRNIYVGSTNDPGLPNEINPNSSINIVSATFNVNPVNIAYDIVTFASPVNRIGTVWVVD